MLTCFYCDAPLFTVGELPKRLLGKDEKLKRIRWTMTVTRDHKTPRALTPNVPNLEHVPSCMPCNSRKGNLTLEEYRVVQAFRYGQIQGVALVFPGEKLEKISELGNIVPD